MKSYLSLFLIAFLLVSCSNDDETETHYFNWSSEDSLDCDRFDMEDIEIDLRKNKGNGPL